MDRPGGRSRLTAFTIPGKPFGKQRPRFSRASGRAFTPAETVSFERMVGIIAMQHFPKPLEGPVRLEVHAVFAPPASWSNRKRAAILDTPHAQRPDIDNLVKAISDAINRVAFTDDAQIAEILARKSWGEVEETVVVVLPL
jgi:Holliday junction resolvase RusA-like endonuclease